MYTSILALAKFTRWCTLPPFFFQNFSMSSREETGMDREGAIAECNWQFQYLLLIPEYGWIPAANFTKCWTFNFVKNSNSCKRLAPQWGWDLCVSIYIIKPIIRIGVFSLKRKMGFGFPRRCHQSPLAPPAGSEGCTQPGQFHPGAIYSPTFIPLCGTWSLFEVWHPAFPAQESNR